MEHLSKLLTVIDQNSWFIKLIIFLFSWFMPSLEASLLLLGLVAIDFGTGVWASVNAGNRFSSKAMQGTITKVGAYMIFIISIHSFQIHFVKTEDIDVFRLLIALPIIRELTSIIENVEKLTGVNMATQAKEILLGFFTKLKKKDE